MPTRNAASRANKFTVVFERGLVFLAACAPAGGAYYLIVSGAGGQMFMQHLVHEVAIAVSLICSGFISFVAVRCYKVSGEVFVGWLALALIGETVIYAPHGVFTRLSHDHMVLFLIYGPASRLVMASLLLIGLVQYDSPAHKPDQIDRKRLWPWLLIFCAINLALAWGSLWHADRMPVLRLWLEYGALVATGTAMMMVLLRPKRSPLMRVYAFSLAGFMTSSVTFIMTTPWTHLWWYAHAVFAAAFLLLSYGVIRAFHSAGSFSSVFSEEQLMAYLREAKENAEQANLKLLDANSKLEILATTDSLTGAANRRHFVERAERELQRARRTNSELAMLLIDLDHFKAINDRFGHATGDVVLKDFVDKISATLRDNDVLGRLGGEEFVVLMPDTEIDQAASKAQRLCQSARSLRPTSHDGQPLDLSVSIGVACSGKDGNTVSDILRIADKRLYRAKESGRDRVIWQDAQPSAPSLFTT